MCQNKHKRKILYFVSYVPVSHKLKFPTKLTVKNLAVVSLVMPSTVFLYYQPPAAQEADVVTVFIAIWPRAKYLPLRNNTVSQVLNAMNFPTPILPSRFTG